jgi:hypothetical protein
MKNILILFLLLFFPIAVKASDPTSLIVLFIEVPTLFIALIFIILSLVLPKLGLIFMTIITVLQIPLLIWASTHNYNGTIMITSFIASIIVLLITVFRHNKTIEKDFQLNIKVEEKQVVLTADETAELEDLLEKSIDILKQKGYSIKTLKYGWKVIPPSGGGRDFYDIEFLYSYALAQ